MESKQVLDSDLPNGIASSMNSLRLRLFTFKLPPVEMKLIIAQTAQHTTELSCSKP